MIVNFHGVLNHVEKKLRLRRDIKNMRVQMMIES